MGIHLATQMELHDLTAGHTRLATQTRVLFIGSPCRNIGTHLAIQKNFSYAHCGLHIYLETQTWVPPFTVHAAPSVQVIYVRRRNLMSPLWATFVWQHRSQFPFTLDTAISILILQHRRIHAPHVHERIPLLTMEIWPCTPCSLNPKTIYSFTSFVLAAP